MEGDWSTWVTYYEISNGAANIVSKKERLVYIPVRGWQYADGNGGWIDDEALTVTGKHMSCVRLNKYHSIYLKQKENQLIPR